MKENYDNIYFLNILYNILQFLEYKNFTYLGTNYEKIINDKKKEEKYKDIKDYEKNVSDYSFMIKNKKYNILARDVNDKYIMMLFLESFYESENDYDINHILKKISFYAYEHSYWQKIIKLYIICPDEYAEKIKKKNTKEGLIILNTKFYSKLSYNPMKHIFSPIYEKKKNYDKKIKKYDYKLPELLINDIVCEWYEFEKNDIIKITRDDKSIIHRIVKDEIKK